MPAAPLPSNENLRLAALRAYDVLDTDMEPAFDDIAALAARLTDHPIALISLLDADRQWFKARHGLDVAETPRELAFCAHAILQPEQPFDVPDAALDPRFADNALVTGPPGLRAYLGIPLLDPQGHALGTLCVLDRQPRRHDEATISTLQTLARTVVTTLELRRAVRQVRLAAMTDGLTGLLNRSAVESQLRGAIRKGLAVTVLLVDLDYLKEANDAHGHAAGDALLRATAERLLASVRPADVVGRIGGDEFAVVLSAVSDRVAAMAFAERISWALSKPVAHAGKMLRLGGTLGVAVAQPGTRAPEMLMRAADEALVRAKRERRGSIGWATADDDERLARSTAILRAFDGAAVREDLPGASVHFQPIVALTGGGPKLLSLEALARWHHPQTGNVPPDQLLPILGIERAGKMGRFVRKEALATVAALRAEGLLDARLAINLSPSEVAQSDVAVTIAHHVFMLGLSLHAVEIEITEEVLLDRVSDRILDQLASLRGRGARLVLDDFGTGNSGLAQLLRLPLDGLKLDKQFVQRLGTDNRAEEIIRATVTLAHGLGLTVVAEGVETERQAAMLTAMKCDAAQGFLFARPMAAGPLRTWLSEHMAPPGVEFLNERRRVGV